MIRPVLRLLLFVALFLLGYAGYRQFDSRRGTPPAAECCDLVETLSAQIAVLPTLPATATPRPTATPLPTATVTASPTAEMIVAPFGSVLQEDGSAATPTPPPRYVSEVTLIERYGEATFRSTDEMPAELAYYFTSNLEEVADFFEVRAEDLEALLRVQNDGLLRIHRAATESGLEGVAQMPPRQWSGWAAPEHERYLTDLRAIEQYGGLGFDWNARHVWLAWQEGRFGAGSPIGISASPGHFRNALSAMARYLLRNGLTRQAAARAPEDYERRLGEAMVPFRQERGSARPIASLQDPVAIPVDPALSAPLREAFEARLDSALAVRLSETDRVEIVDSSHVAVAIARGEVDAETGAEQLWQETVQRYLAEGQAARAEGRPLPWPFVENELQLATQQMAVALIGHTLAPWEMESLLEEAGHDIAAAQEILAGNAEATLFAEIRERLDAGLQRSARGLPLRLHEVTRIAQPALASVNLRWLGESDRQRVLGDVEYVMRRLPEFRELNGDLFFSATPFNPMPDRILKPFGSPARYQPGGIHTGLDLRVRRGSGGEEPPIYAVEAGTVAYVGPLFCNQEGLCRGPYAIIIDHGRQIYTIYSHNSEAVVRAGDVVAAGQMIGRQGNLGYSRGPHLHLEVHVGVPFSGDWTDPWRGGQYVDPWPWLPRDSDPFGMTR